MGTKRILFLGYQTEIAKKCLALMQRPEYRGQLQLKALVAKPNFFESEVINLKTSPVFISNEARNETEILAVIAALKIDTLISLQHPWIISTTIIDAVKGCAFNLHNAKLPEYRGHHAINHALLNGEDTFTTTIHWITDTIDGGDIAFEETFGIDRTDTALSLYAKSCEASVRNFKKLVTALRDDIEIPRIKITSTGRFYRRDEAAKLKEIKSMSDFTEVDRKARAFYFPPYEPAYFVLNGTKFYVSHQPY